MFLPDHEKVGEGWLEILIRPVRAHGHIGRLPVLFIRFQMVFSV